MEIKNYVALARFAVLILVIVGLNTEVLLAQIKPETNDAEVAMLSPYQASEILWLSRVIYSESKQEDEQLMVAWVVRNRVDNTYRGARNYQEVATDPKQFSGLNDTDENYEHNISRNLDSGGVAWESAMAIANDVYFAKPSLSPISAGTMHFYSPVAVSAPNWAEGENPVHTVLDDAGNMRFAFYENIR